ncbi:MAG: hypothetical protein L6R45_14825 [Anaerolineae bacterium]|nr:hypothetical protein [Anaerolineae bacterium]
MISLSTVLVSVAQVRMLSEGIVEPLSACASLPEDLGAKTRLTEPQIRRGLPEAKAFGLRDCRYLGWMMGNS